MHDVLPSTSALTPLYRCGVCPFAVARAAYLLYHARCAADPAAVSVRLLGESGIAQNQR
jgi:hypothetical protein